MNLNLGYFVSIVKRDHPTWPTMAIRWQARKMFERHDVLLKARDAGLAMGRDLRQRMEHGLGVFWPELEPLTPQERGFVLALVKHEIQPKTASLPTATLESVKEQQVEEERNEREDYLQAEWQAKSAMPDKAVKVVKEFPKGALI